MVQAGLRSANGQSGSSRHVGDRHAQVVVEDEDVALSHREPAKGPLQKVAIIHRDIGVVDVHVLDGKSPRAVVPSPAASGLGVAGMGEDAMKPGLEAGRVTQGSELGPGGDEGGLHSVLGDVAVAHNAARRRQASGAYQPRQRVECVSVASLCPEDQIVLNQRARHRVVAGRVGVVVRHEWGKSTSHAYSDRPLQTDQVL